MSLEEDILSQRLARVKQIEALGFKPYGHRFDFTHTLAQVRRQYGARDREELERDPVTVRVCGRIQTIRRMGKAGFAHLAQEGERLQIYVRRDNVPAEHFTLYKKLLDIGDIIGVEGRLFRTKTNELSVMAEKLYFLSKTLLNMPEKWHGLEDVETRYRQRYLDLIANPEVRRVFLTRARIIGSFRRQLESRGFLEVETPMMQPVYGGATARPFITHHNALNIDLYLRIAPELYLKRLVIGGLERVYEINRNFRNEGISTQHNPEFTMLEAYQAYADYEDMMELFEALVCHAAQKSIGTLNITYQGRQINLSPPWRRLPMLEAIKQYAGIDLTPEEDVVAQAVEKLDIEVEGEQTFEAVLNKVFDRYVEPELIQPTFITDFPTAISPLAKQKPDRPELVDRFEPFVGGLEIGNAFSELNDPLEQRKRFEAQVQARAAGDEEAHPMDEDFLRALEYGMPPCGGLGLGVDRLVMLLTDQASLREVIFFPHLRPEKR